MDSSISRQKWFIKLRDHKPIYDYPLIRICGSVRADGYYRKVPDYINLSGTTDHQITIWPIIHNNFQILIHLSDISDEQIFKLWLDDSKEKNAKIINYIEFKVRYQSPPKRDLFVRLIYLTCNNLNQSCFEDGRFDGPEESEDCSIESGLRRISIGALMSQCFFAATIGKTYQLELNKQNLPIVHRFHLNYKEQELWELNERDHWKLIANSLMNDSNFASFNCKYVVFISYSRYRRECDDPSQPRWNPSDNVNGFISLGGGSLATLSTHCLYTWPETVNQISDRINDNRMVDTTRFMNDSNHHGTLSGCFLITLGASIHELGHTFNLAHSSYSIMGEYFKFLDHFFCSGHYRYPILWWTKSEIVILSHHHWFSSDISIGQESDNFEIDTKSLMITSKYGLSVAEYRKISNDKVLQQYVWEHRNKLQFRSQIEQNGIELFVMDHMGNICTIKCWKE